MKDMNISASHLFLILISMLLSACNGASGPRDIDYTHFVQNSYASRFRLSEAENYTVLEITDPWQGAENVRQTWYLVPREEYDSFVPPGVGNILSVPVQRIVCMSATHVAMLSALGANDVIAAVSGTGLIYNPEVRELIDSGVIKDVGYDESMNRELLIELEPDVIIAYGVGSESVASHGKLTELGLKVLYNAEYLETEPLGKAEWIRVFGALLCREELADSVFGEAEKEYNEIRKMVSGASDEPGPNVLLGLPWKDAWYISPGNSYISRLIDDAGGRYLWRETMSNISMPYNLENVYLKAVDAKFWINPGSAASISDIQATDSRLALLDAVKMGNVFNNDKRTMQSGANDYWETGCVRPGLILRDLAMIFNEKLLIEDSLMFYRKLK
ncbi:MAG: ABC transporter substrate-binding protein [Bacteroidales bacterium]|nr:ABC transporter substrate-binding protein [Bacteroidales bacterium]